MSQFNKTTTVEISLERYDELIRSEYSLHLLQNALEDMNGYSNIDDLKKHFGIYCGGRTNE